MGDTPQYTMPQGSAAYEHLKLPDDLVQLLKAKMDASHEPGQPQHGLHAEAKKLANPTKAVGGI